MKSLLQSIQRRPLNLAAGALAALLYGVNTLWLKKALPQNVRWFFTCYWNDLLCPLVFFPYANLLLLTADREITALRTILLTAAGLSAVWELAAPLLKPGAVADPVDAVCYFAGSIFYWFLLRCARKRQK